LRFLLDTHIWIWLLQSPERLARRTSQELADPKNELWLSPVSTWEALTLFRKGRIQLPADLKEWISGATFGTHEAPLTHEIALDADPADRLLAATAQVLDLTLVTADQKLLGLGNNIRTMANR
jgi:PIN domain nuclease of toxin-antitoxin system